MALNRSDKSRILRRYFPGMTRNSEMSTEPRDYLKTWRGNQPVIPTKAPVFPAKAGIYGLWSACHFTAAGAYLVL